MEYIPGQIHEYLQKIHFFEVNSERSFVWSNCVDRRYKDFKDISDWDNYIKVVDINAGDILLIRFFKYSSLSNAHCYLEKIIRGDVEIDFFTESTISKDFLEVNSGFDKHLPRRKLFTDVTDLMERDKKINQIIN